VFSAVVGRAKKPPKSINRRPSASGHFVLDVMLAAGADWCCCKTEAGSNVAKAVNRTSCGREDGCMSSRLRPWKVNCSASVVAAQS
jgi:hypothetical protein